MPSLSEVRKKYPQYDDLSDSDLAKALHGKYYSDLGYDDFLIQIGLKQAPTTSKASAYGKAIVQGALFGLADELGAGARMAEERDLPLSMQSGVNPFTEQLELSRQSLDTSRKEYPEVFKNVVPIAAATTASLGVPAGLLSSVPATALAGGWGGATEEAAQEGSTPGSIALSGLKSGAQMAGAEVAGLGLGALAKKLIAPNLPLLGPLKRIRQATQEPVDYTMNALKNAIVPKSVQNSAMGSLLRTKAGEFVSNELLDTAIDMTAVPAATALFGPGVGGAVWLGKQSVSPGYLIRYLSNSSLPGAGVRRASDTATKLALRGLLGYADEEDDSTSD